MATRSFRAIPNREDSFACAQKEQSHKQSTPSKLSKRLTSMFLVLAMFISLVPVNAMAANETSATVFPDVKATDYYAKASIALKQLGILTGYPDGTFGAENQITRAEMAAIVCRIIDKEAEAKESKGLTTFDDVPDSHWASGYINIASKEGIINGDGTGNFRPDDYVTYEEAIKMVVCSLGYNSNLEIDPKDWSKAYLEVATEKGITVDLKGGKGQPSTRGDVAVMVYNGLATDAEDSRIPATPVASKEAGTHYDSVRVKLTSTTKDADIYYTTDGAIPTVESTKYTKEISIFKTTTLKAIAVKNGVVSKDVMSVEYTIRDTVDIEDPNIPLEPTPNPPADNTFTVSFDLNYEGATNAPEAQTVEAGEKAIEPDEPIRETHVFIGWFENIDSSEKFDFDASAITGNLVLKAKWIDLTDTTDTDNDELIDVLEEYHKTDKTLDDTDNDGINDFIELAELGTDPLNFDTDGNGVSDGEEDMDEDGLTNTEEISFGTNPLVKDSDVDGLSDFDELKVYYTNPLKADTDDDGADDGWEVENGTDPLIAQTTFKVNISAGSSEENVIASVQIDLTGEQAETLSISPFENSIFFPETMPGYMGKAYDFSVDGEFESAIISFEFDPSKLEEGAEPVIYYFNEETQELEELETTINGNIASATVTHFSKYILIDRRLYQSAFKWQDVWVSDKNYTGVEVVLVIDDSGSMDSNDEHYKRLDVAKNMVDNLPQNSKIGVIQFSSKSTILTSSLTENKDVAKKYLTTDYFKSGGLTYMYHAINDAFSLYGSPDNSVMRVMVVLTDGSTFDTNLHSSTIVNANSKDVKIYTVGLGDSTSYFDRYLKPLAANTGGTFYLAEDAEDLSDIYNDISEKIDIETDSDEDGIPDYYEDNMIIFSGVELELDKNNPDTDGDGLLDGEELELNYEYNEDRTKVKVTGKLFANPINKHSDEDAYDDYSEIYVYNTNPFKRNIIIEDSYLSLLTNDDYYYASSYKDRYENDFSLRASIWLGNNVYGSNHSAKQIYKQALLKYFEKLNAGSQSVQEANEAYNLALDFVNAATSAIEVASDELSKSNAVDALDYMKNLEQQADNIRKNLAEMKYDGSSSKTAFYAKIDELQSALHDATTKHDEIKNALTKGPDGKMRLEVKVPDKLKGLAKTFDVGLDIVNTVIIPAKTAYDGYVQLMSNINIIRSNIYILDSIIETTDNDALKEAAKELKTASESEFNARSNALIDGIKNTVIERFWSYCHDAVTTFVPYGFWIELGLGVANFIVPVSDSAKEGLTIYGMAKVADALSVDISGYLSSGKQRDFQNNVIYAMYDAKGPESANRFTNFAEMRIYGEEKMIDLQSLGANWLKALLKLLGSDSEAIIDHCNDTIDTIDGFKHRYSYKY